MKRVRIDWAGIEEGLWTIRVYLMNRYGVDKAEQNMAPLTWYIGTGRASCDFIRAVLTAKPFMIGRKLNEGGTYDEAINRVKKYIGYND